MSIKIALAGNPNCGKTTLFNRLTGSNQYVGNWPGVTVEKKEGKLKGHDDVVITDLPGIYSLSPYTLEEVVARNYLIDETPDVILNIVDGSNLERNLYLTTQLKELGIPMVIALNMMDVVKKAGDDINMQVLSEKLGCPIYPISALNGDGVDAAADAAAAAGNNEKKSDPLPVFEGDVADAITRIEGMLTVPEHEKAFAAVKVFERDSKIAEKISVPDCESIIKAVEDAHDDDAESIVTNARYTFIGTILEGAYVKKNKGEMTTSDRIDRIVTNRILGLPIFAVVMFFVYYIAVTTVGTFVTDWTNDGLFGDGWHMFGIGTAEAEEATNEYAVENIFTDDLIKIVSDANDAGVIGADEVLAAAEDGDFAAFDEAFGTYGDELAENGYDISEMVDAASEGLPDSTEYGMWVPGIPVIIESALDAVGCGDFLKSLVLDGIVAGVGAVLGFVPQMLVLFLMLAFLEGCGYMARVAFIMDRIFRRFGLSGKSFIPMLIGSGCGVPGVMASRTIESDRDRKMTIMTTTFIPCGAKLPIIALVSAALFGGASWVAPSAYFLGIASIIISGIILKKTKMFAGDPAPFVMELPAYHMPRLIDVLKSMWERGSSFIKRAGTIILLSSIIIWAGSCFGYVDGAFGFSTDMELSDSVLGMFGNAVKWIFAPLGFADATATVATIMGLVAKEEVVGVFGVLDFISMTPIAGYSFLAFNLLCAPCFAAMGAIKREMNNGKWFAFAVCYQCVYAYAIALMVYQFGNLLTGGGFSVFTIVALAVLVGMVYMLVKKNNYSDNELIYSTKAA